MASNYLNSAGTDFDNLFDPDVVGDGPTAATFKKSDGTLLKYAAAKYGTVGPNTGYTLSNNADVTTLWAAKGTAAYALGCDGMVAHSSEILTNQQSGYGIAQFIINDDGTYSLQTIQSPNPTVNYTKTVNTGNWNTLGGAASGYQVRFSVSNIHYPNGSGIGCTISNDATSFTTISGSLIAQAEASGGFQGGSREVTCDLKIELLQISTGRIFSTTIVHFDAEVDGSV